jgi:glycosyltransferase involved in cell wall biosynthesis
MFPWGGVEKHIFELADYLKDVCHHNVFILTFKVDQTLLEVLPPEGYKKASNIQLDYKDLIKYNVYLIRLPKHLRILKFLGQITSTSILSIVLYRALVYLIRRKNIDIIYSCEPLAILATSFISFFNRNLRKNIGLIASIHSSWSFKSSLRRALASKSLRRFDKIVVSTIDITTYKRIREIVESKCHFIPNWIDIERFKPQPHLRNEARKLLNLSPSDIVILYNARLVPSKNPINVILAFKLLKNKEIEITNGKRSFKLVMIGAGELKHIVSFLACKLGLEKEVIILDSIPYFDYRYPYIYNIADIFVLVPKHTGFSITALEALASGLPVVYSSVTGVPQDIKNKIICADPDDPNNIMQKILLAYRYARQDNMLMDAVTLVRRRYSKAFVLHRLANVVTNNMCFRFNEKT